MVATATCNDSVWLVIGDLSLPHCVAVRQWLERVASVFADDLADACATLQSGCCSPDAVVVYQSFPREFERDDVEQFIGTLPFCRWVVIYGHWCESIGRTEQIWPIGWCVPLNDAVSRLESERNAAVKNLPLLPATMSRDEMFAQEAARLDQTAFGTGQTAWVSCSDRAYSELLKQILERLGYHIQPKHPAEWVILAEENPETLSSEIIHDARVNSPESRIIVVTDFATDEHRIRWKNGGVDAVVSQLRLVEALQTHF